MEKNKSTVIAIVAALVLVLAIVIWSANKKDEPKISEPSSEEQAEVESVEDTTEGSVNAPAAATAPAKLLSYKEALVLYKDRRIQLDTVCQAHPNAATFKNGSSIMVDNRSAVTRTVKLGSTFTIKGYGFKIVKLSSSTVPATWLIDCDSSQNVATILIQK